MNFKNVYILIYGVFFIGCSSYNKLDDNKEEFQETIVATDEDSTSKDFFKENDDIEDDSDPLIVLIFSVYKGTKSDSISLDLTRFTKGNLKRDFTIPANSEIPAGQWKCTFLTDKLLPITALILDDPLVQVMEHFNHAGEGSNDVEELDKGSIMVRVQDYQNNMKFVFLEKTNKNGEIIQNRYFKLNR